MDKFKYHILFDTEIPHEKINELGKIGWELVTHATATHSYTIRHYFTFKRKIKQDISDII